MSFAFGCGLSGHLDAQTAAEQACDQAIDELALSAACDGGGAAADGGEEQAQSQCSVDLAVVFCSAGHAQHAARIAEVVRNRLRPLTMIGTTAASLIGGASELEDEAGVSVLAAHMPGVTIHPFDQRDIMPFDDATEKGLARLAEGMGLTSNHLYPLTD